MRGGEREVSGDGEDLGECPAVGDRGDPQRWMMPKGGG